MNPSVPTPPRQLELTLDTQQLHGLRPGQRAEVLVALAMMLREAADAEVRNERL